MRRYHQKSFSAAKEHRQNVSRKKSPKQINEALIQISSLEKSLSPPQEGRREPSITSKHAKDEIAMVEKERKERDEKCECEDMRDCEKQIRLLEGRLQLMKGNSEIGMRDRKVKKVHLLERGVDGQVELGVEYDGNLMIKMQREKVKEIHLKQYVELLQKFI